jgi:hypothetical protein
VKYLQLLVVVFITPFLFLGCGSNTQKAPQLADTSQFVKYWFMGNAEINHYELDQAQYGSMHKGDVTLVFVTEGFRVDKQVKDDGNTSKDKTATVMKMNAIRRFTTGIYDYSAMTSAFTPVSVNEFPNALKVSCSVQDWCGQSYSQLNFKQNGYYFLSHSYFENEVKADYHIDKGTTEDELLNSIRLMPDRLPIGDKMMIPSLLSTRLRHKKVIPILATLKLYDYNGGDFKGSSLKVYEIDYKGDERNVRIVFENIFPHKIVGIDETYKFKDVYMTSRARLKKTILSPYWLQNQPVDSTARRQLMTP